MENGKIKSIHKKLIGPLKMARLMDIKANTFISMLKNGKIKLHGGALQLKVMLKLTLKRLILNPQNFQILTVKQDQPFKRWCSIWDKNNKVFQHQMNSKNKEKCNNLWKLIHKWTFLNVNSVDLFITVYR